MSDDRKSIKQALVEHRAFGLPCAELGPGKHDFIAVADIEAALASSPLPAGGLTRSQARRIEDVLEELDVDDRSWSEVERDALRALARLASAPNREEGDG